MTQEALNDKDLGFQLRAKAVAQVAYVAGYATAFQHTACISPLGFYLFWGVCRSLAYLGEEF